MDEGNLLIHGSRIPDERPVVDDVSGRLTGGCRADIRIVAGRIAEVSPELRPRSGEEVLDATGAVVLPGLHDHHLHLRSLAALASSVAVGPGDVTGVDGLTAALRAAPVDTGGWRRAVGYHQSVAGSLDRWSLDAMVPGARVRVQHRSGAMWIISSPGIEALGLDDSDAPGIERDGDGQVTGRLFRMDAWLATRLPDRDPLDDVAVVSSRLAERGVTGLTDATPGATAAGTAAVSDALSEGRLLQRAHVMGPTGVDLGTHPLMSRGPHKVILDDVDLPGIDALAETIRSAHAARLPVAVHCVTAVQLVTTIAAFDEAGSEPGDRIEHAALVPPDLLPRLARLGVTVVVNPGFILDRGDAYLEEVDTRDLPGLHRCASLRSAGIAVAAGTDAPFGPPDPWVTMSAACRRRTRSGRFIGPDEAVSVSVALSLFLGRADDPARLRRIGPGEPGDVCLLRDGALPAPAGEAVAEAVAATVVAGRIVYSMI